MFVCWGTLVRVTSRSFAAAAPVASTQLFNQNFLGILLNFGSKVENSRAGILASYIFSRYSVYVS